MTFQTRNALGSWGLSVWVLLLSVMAGQVVAQASETFEFSIESQELGDALTEFGITTGQQVLFKDAEVRGKTARQLDGDYSAEEAVKLLLDGSGVRYRVDENGTLLVGTEAAGQRSTGNQLGLQPLALAQEGPGVGGQASRSREVQSGRGGEDEEVPQEFEVIVVTGTNLRGIAPDSSPVLTFDREDILSSGASTAEEFIQTLPQNFGGGANADLPIFVGGDANSAFNTGVNGGSIGTGVNLRGLGSGSTLVLLNGRRIAPSSGIGDFVDVSMIPASAIERVEVLTDGASSIYGGDAVAGVINFIMRDDFDGLETAVRYGMDTTGDTDEYRVNIAFGKNWEKGNGVVVFEAFEQADLSTADRSFSEDAPLPNDLTPSQERYSVLASLTHSVTDSLDLSADASFSTRDTKQDTANTLVTFFGTAEASVDNLNIGVGAEWDLSEDWYIDFASSYSTVTSETDNVGSVNTSREIESDIWTADIIASGSAFSLPAGDVRVAVGGHFRSEDFFNENLLTDFLVDREADREVYALFAEILVPFVSPDQNIRGIHRLDLNLSGRIEDYSDFGSTSDPKVGLVWSPVEPLRFRGSYSTSFKPPPLGRVGANDLGAAVISTGLVNFWLGQQPPDPSIADVVLLSLSGTDQDLEPETSTAYTLGFDFEKKWGKHDLSLSATYFDIEYEGGLGTPPIPGNVSLLLAANIAFVTPEAFPPGTVTFFPSDEERTRVLDSLDNVNSPFGSDPNAAEIISRAGVVTNLARTEVSGYDIRFTYSYQLDAGQLNFGIDGTDLDRFAKQAGPNTPEVEQQDTLFNPVSLNLRGRAGFSRGGLSTNLFIRYVDSYRSDSTASATGIGSWTTFDLNIAYDSKDRFNGGLLEDVVVRVSIVNLFDEDPPSAPGDPSVGIFGYDPTNANPLGRFMSLEVTKRW